MTQQRTPPEEEQQAIQQQARKLVSQVAGYVGVRTMEIGLRFGLLDEISKHPQGISAEVLASQKSLDPFIGAIPTQIVQPEIFDLFAEKLPSGEQVWYDQLRPAYIQMISQTTRSFYTRLIP